MSRRHWPFVAAQHASGPDTGRRLPTHDELGRALERDTAVQGEPDDAAERSAPPPAPPPAPS